VGFSESLRSRPQPTGPNARNAAKFELGVPFARERTNIHHFQRVIIGELGEFPTARIGNPLFLTENTKQINDLWSTSGPGGPQCSDFNRFAQKNERRSKTARR
jgi:hypothetical protein